MPVQTQSRLCIRRALERTCRVERVVTSSASPLAHLLPAPLKASKISGCPFREQPMGWAQVNWGCVCAFAVG